MSAKPNRLSKEKSPYLLQHAENPVDWYPWCEEAFTRAVAENKPVFLSIGYSTCHWCHVMARESFENQSVADLLNRWFVAIKVDREERPDIDHFYMTATQLLTGGGGWPMSVFLFPDKRPFYAGTYFPLQGVHGRPGFSEVLTEVHRFWLEQGADLQNTAARVMEALERSGRGEISYLGDGKAAKLCYQQLLADFDEKHGGFGGAPKFPRPVVLNFLFRYWHRHAEEPALQAALASLRAMAGGGMYDHLGGGFHRYSVDNQWRIPHFEKMLYDQAQLAHSYLDARQITGDDWYGSIASEIFRYVLRDMRDPGGGFYSAEDADSPDPYKKGKHCEGGYYLWTEAEIVKTLGKGRANIFCRFYGVEAGGNALVDPSGEFRGKNVLYLARLQREVAIHIGLGVQDVERLLAESKQLLFEKRCERDRPHLDDKIIVSWNGLMIGAMARGAVILNNPQLQRAAVGAAEFIRQHMYDAGPATLKRRYWRGSAGLAGLLEDYAFLTSGLLELYEITADPDWLQWAVQLTETQINRFWDEDGRGFFNSVEGASLPMRLKNTHDGAEPSGNSVAAMNLLRLSELTGNAAWKKKAGQALEAFSQQLNNYPTTLVQMLCALDRFMSSPSRVVIVGPAGDEGVQKLAATVYQNFDPDRVVFLADKGQNQKFLAESLPVMGEFDMVNGKAAAYVCRNFSCKTPITDPRELQTTLSADRRRELGLPV